MSFPVFDRPVPAGGYAWWYIDALSDDGQYGVTVIAFIGNVFSPYYHHARRFHGAAGAAAENHCAINIALYGPQSRWAMTERRAEALAVDPQRLSIGNSALHWDGQALTVDIDERGAPLPRQIRGQLIVRPPSLTAGGFDLDPGGHHHWHPIAPRSRVSLRLDAPELSWDGDGYLDHNRGDRALETDFRRWEWSRANIGNRAAIHYDTVTRDGHTQGLALRIARDARIEHVPAAAWQPLAPTPIWRMPRHARSEDATRTRVTRTLEDTPFYSRSSLATRIDGQTAEGVHESLSLERFETPWVRTLLRFRMPRVV